jgi:hypothetical protein
MEAPYENLNELKKPNASNEALNENTACYHNNWKANDDNEPEPITWNMHQFYP